MEVEEGGSLPFLVVSLYIYIYIPSRGSGRGVGLVSSSGN